MIGESRTSALIVRWGAELGGERGEELAENVEHGFGIRGEETEHDAGIWEG